jgi:transposase
MVFGSENIVFTDECGVDEEYLREYGWAPAGVRVHDVKCGKRGKRTNIIGGLMGKKHVALSCYNQSVTGVIFEDWFEHELLAVIPGNSLVILDNASHHRKKYLRAIAERYGVGLLFLPKYSPDFNLIERSWANFKRWLRDNLHRFPNHFLAVDSFFSL